MRNILFILIKFILIPVFISVLSTSLYTLIYVAQANAQEKNKNKKSEPIIIQNKTLLFDDLKQVPDTVKAMTIINGKTFVGYNGKTYMLASMDIELETGDYAREGKDLLEQLIQDKILIIFQTKNKKFGRQNRMGHNIVHVLRETDQTWIQASLIANGVARVRTTPFNPEQATQMLVHEEKARTNKTGLWKEEAYTILTQDNAEESIGGFHVVEGVIKKVATTKNNIYLNFGDTWKTDFTVGVTPKTRRILSKKNISPITWSGKKIRVRGWIRSYNGPYIELTHAEQIQIIEDKPDAPNNQE